jgi:glucokinase
MKGRIMEERVLCYDMGGRRIRAAVATRRRILASVNRDIPARCDNRLLSSTALQMAGQVLRASRTPARRLLGIGYGAAGEWHGLVIRFSPNNPVRHDITVARDVRDKFCLPTLGANDLKAAVHAVPVYGHGRGRDLAVVCAITYSDGNNISILNRNRPYPGYSDLSQEVGHAHIEHGPCARWCGCGAQGCFEAYVSGTAAAHMAIEVLLANWTRRHEQPILRIARRAILRKRRKERKGGPLTEEQVLLGVRAEHVYEALARHNDPISRHVRDVQKYYIAQQLAHVCLHHRPQLIELFGGLTNQGKLLFAPAIADLRRHPARYSSASFEATDIRITDLGDDIGLYGAASMVFLAHETGTLE